MPTYSTISGDIANIPCAAVIVRYEDPCGFMESRAPDWASGDGVAGGCSEPPARSDLSRDDPDWR